MILTVKITVYIHPTYKEIIQENFFDSIDIINFISRKLKEIDLNDMSNITIEIF